MARYNDTETIDTSQLRKLACQMRLMADQIDAHLATMEHYGMNDIDVLLWKTTLDASHNLSRFSGKIAQAIITKAGPITEEVQQDMAKRRGRTKKAKAT